MAETESGGGGKEDVVRPPRPTTTKPPEGNANTPSEVRPPIEVSAEPKKAQPSTPVEQEVFADRALLSAHRTNEIYRDHVSDTSLYNAPDTTFWTAGVRQDPATTAVTDEVLKFFASVYGSEDLAAFLAAELLPEPQRAATYAALAQLRQNQGALAQYQPQVNYQPGRSVAREYTDDELTQLALAGDQTVIEGLGVADKARLAGIADDFLTSLQDLPDMGLAEDIKRAVYIGTRGASNVALSRQDVALLEQVKERLGGLNFGGTTAETPEFASVGIEQVRQLGEGVIVLDVDWAKKNIAEAYAVKTWLEMNHPEMEIQFGREGIWGSVLDKISMPVDYVTAPLGAGLHQLSEFGEKIGVNLAGGSREEYLRYADAIEQAVNSGEIPEGQVESALSDMHFLRDQGTEELGISAFRDQVIDNTRPRHIGFGFADSFVKSAQIYPGDPGYSAAYAASGLLGALVFDPLNWGPAVVGGVKAARLVPKGSLRPGALDNLDEITEALRSTGQYSERQVQAAARRIQQYGEIPEVGQGWIKNSVYRRLAKTPEELAVTKPFARATDRLWRLRSELGPDKFSSALGQFFTHNARQLGGDTEIARLLSQATSKEDMALAVTRAMSGTNWQPQNADQLIARLSEVDNELDAINQAARGLPPAPSAARDDLIAERAFLGDLVNGRDWVRPMQSLMSSKQMRQLERVSGKPLGVHGKALSSVISFTERFPSNVLTHSRNVDENGIRTAKQALVSLENMYKDTGAGTVLSFPHTSSYAKALRRVGGEVMDDAVQESFQAISDIARYMGLKQDRINDLLAPWTRGELTSGSKSYYWWRETWTSIVDESPRLTANGKQELRGMWRSLVEDRSPGYVTREGALGDVPEPTLFKIEVDPVTGRRVPYGKPAFEADQFQTWRLPSLGDLRQHMTITQRTMNDWGKTGGFGRKAISGAHAAIGQTFTAVSSFWRSAVLGFRLFGALPARIGMEQMLRIAAYDYASMVWHPVEWFNSTKWGTQVNNLSDVALFTDSPVHALGTMIDTIDSHPNASLIRAARENVTITDGAPYYRAYSERLGRMYASPSVHNWHLPYLGDSDATLASMREGRHAEEGADWLASYAEYGMDPAEAVARTQQEITQMIGQGAGADIIRTALRRGQVNIDGELVRVGTADFAEALQRMADRGDWIPGTTKLNRASGDYLPIGRVPALSKFKDKMFRLFYSAPDLALSRSPLYRQIGARHYRNLIRIGYKPENALRIARSHAARSTAEMMFTIGAKTSGEYFLRNISPFFPAYRELATTWLKRIPMRIGEGHWALGSAALIRRADIWQQFFQDLGIVRKDDEGNMDVPIPFMNPVVKMFTGQDTEYSVTAPLESFAGVLPVPIGVFDRDDQGNLLPWHQRLKGIMPTLGAPSAAALGVISDIFGGALEDVEQWTTLYGTDASLGPVAVDRAFEAFGIYMPWMSGTTKEYHEAVRTWAVIDGMRIARERLGEPPTDPEERKAYIEDLLEQGERYAMGTYLLRSITGMTLPFSVQISDEGKEQTSALWGLVNSLPEDGPVRGSLIDSVLTEYPNLEPYMTGKTQDTRLAEDPNETLDEFMDAVKSGKIEIRSAEDWAVFSLGMNSYSIYQSRVNAIYENATSPADWILSFNAKNAVQRERMAWQDFLDSTQDVDNFLPGQTQSFADMFNTYQEYKDARDGETERLSREQERLLDFDFAMKEFARYFSPNPDTSDDYYALRDAAFEALGGQPSSDIGKAQQWYFGEVSAAYYDQRDALYEKLDGLNDDEKAPVFQKIRNLADKYNKDWVNSANPEWGEFPSPEEYVFMKLDPEDQERQVADWATLPAYFLTEFQREQVGYDIPEGKQKAASKLADFVTENEIEFDKALIKYDISTASDAYEINRANYDAAYAQRAEKLGLADYWRQQNLPEYKRLGQALDLGSRSPTWAVASKAADQAIRQIETTEYATGEFYSRRGDSDLAVRLRRQFAGRIRAWRRDDGVFDQIMTDLSIWLADEGQQLGDEDLVDILFFDVYRP